MGGHRQVNQITLCAVMCCAAVVSLTKPQHAVAAEPPAINAQSFELAPGARDALITRSALRQDQGRWSRSWTLTGGLHYTRRALAFVNNAGSAPMTQVILGDMWMLDLGASVGWRQWTFEATLPLALALLGEGPDIAQVGAARYPAFGDLRLGARRWLLRRAVGGLGAVDIGAYIGYGAPTAASGSWLGGTGTQLDTAALISWTQGNWSAHLNLGGRWRGESALVITSTDPQTGRARTASDGEELTERLLVTGSALMARLAVVRALPLPRQARVVLAAQWQQPLGDVTPGQHLLEGYLQGSFDLDARSAFRLFAAFSGAATSGLGSAQARAIVGLRAVPGRLPNDRDGDGLDDRDDGCPNRAEDVDGFEDKDGCPDPDNDGDRVPDAVDKCPLAAEDNDGFEDDDGCPDQDNDKDGLPDVEDKCPNQPEDRDNFDDRDGCPDPDNDGDGISDKDDLCPNRPETRNGTLDRDGCPDQVKAPGATIQGNRVILRDKVQFAFGGAVLTAAGRAALDAAVALITANKRIVGLLIRGHTDDNGEAADLQMLSKQRAIAARDYLERRGALAAGKITAEGMGASAPIASNETLAGRSSNRRIELIVTQWAPTKTAPPPEVKRADTPAMPATKTR